MGQHAGTASTDAKMKKPVKVWSSKFPFPKVQLHCHLDGCIRFTTLFELAKQKHIEIAGVDTLEQLRERLITRTPSSLGKVLEAFNIFLPLINGDTAALERVAYEMCEDQALSGVIYFEARYSANLLSTEKVSPDEVIEAIERGFRRGESNYGIQARHILCCIRGHDVWNKGIVELAAKYQKRGVVAIDAAGCSHGSDEKYEPSVVEAFIEARRIGLHRTVHAGEAGLAASVIRGIEEMGAERIGHGYHILMDEEAYRKYGIEQRVHFEACPLSSVMTSSVSPTWSEHPVKRWAADGVNFSISTDDPTCFDNSMESELTLVQDEIGLSLMQLWQCQMNAAQSCFLPDAEKATLVERVNKCKPTENDK